MIKEVKYVLPIPSAAFLKGVEFQKRIQRTCALVFKYEDEIEDKVRSLSLLFKRVESFKCNYYNACSPDLTKSAYEKVVDFGDTLWLREISMNLREWQADSNGLIHLGIYFDDEVSYEFICREFSVEEVVK